MTAITASTGAAPTVGLKGSPVTDTWYLTGRKLHALVRQPVVIAFGVVQPVALGEGPVPHDPDAAERARQHLLLRLIRVSPAPVSRPHPDRIARLIEKPLEPRRAGVCLLVPLHGAPESSRPEGRGIPRRYW